VFDPNDRATSPSVAIVNEAFVRRHYPDGRAVGRRLKGGDFNPAGPWTTVVGIVADVPYGKGLWGGADATVYRPYAQNLWVQSPYVIVKAPGDPSRMMPIIQESVKRLDPSLPLRDFATMGERVRLSMLEPRLRSLLFSMIGGLALALSVTGIYGVMAYHVTERRRETAIRRALGARIVDVVGAILVTGLRLTFVGILLGTAGAVLLTKSLATMLFQVSPHDPATLIMVALLLTSASLVACLVPALRSSRIEPVTLLRDE
jgi:putative ABC transport system permease protein